MGKMAFGEQTQEPEEAGRFGGRSWIRGPVERGKTRGNA